MKIEFDKVKDWEIPSEAHEALTNDDAVELAIKILNGCQDENEVTK